MMKINLPLLEQSILIDKATTFVIEDQALFTQVIKDLYYFDENRQLKIYHEDFCLIKLNELLVITDIFGFEVNSASVLKLIYNDLENQLNEKPEVKTKIEQLANQITELIDLELISHELDLESDEITVLELFKALGIKIETQSDTIYEKMYEILQIFKYLSKKKLLVFVNVCSYFSNEEFQELQSYISLSNMDVLFLEPRSIENNKQYILDRDFYLTFHDMLQ